jgi:hypothetical protein
MKLDTLLLLLATLLGQPFSPAIAPPDPAAAPSTAVASSPVDPCQDLGSLARQSDDACAGAPLCSAPERVQIACGLRDAMEQRYVFFPVKGQLLAGGAGPAFDARQQLDACAADERAIAREDDPLRFYDRMRRCTAAFADGHLMLGAPVRLPHVALGIGLRLAGGRVFVANRERKLVSFLQASSGLRDLDALLAPGNEVLEIDGRPAAQQVAELAPYLPSSSDAARLERAVDALTRRDFAFPARRTAKLTIEVAGARRTVELPWWVSPDARTHVMAQAWLRKAGVGTTELLDWKYDQTKGAWERDGGDVRGSLRSDSIVSPRDAAGLREYTSDGGQPAARLGEVVLSRDRAFCYAQLLTFFTERLDGPGGRRPFGEVLGGFVKQCQEKRLDLVIDVRQNDGGYLSHSSALLSELGEPSKAYPSGALLLRASASNQLVFQQRVAALGNGSARASDDALEPHHIAEALGAARKARQEFTPGFLEGTLRTSEAVGGYTGKVVALIGPGCMSACDRFAALLRASKRGVLVGAPTEGAGGSQQETRELPVRWTDPNGVLSVSIPNAAMGVQAARPAPGERHGDLPFGRFFSELAFENRPVPPDVSYATTVDDLTHSNRGWLEKVDGLLFGVRASRTGDAVVAQSP